MVQDAEVDSQDSNNGLDNTQSGLYILELSDLSPNFLPGQSVIAVKVSKCTLPSFVDPLPSP